MSVNNGPDNFILQAIISMNQPVAESYYSQLSFNCTLRLEIILVFIECNQPGIPQSSQLIILYPISISLIQAS
jgi:hypothetical protein